MLTSIFSLFHAPYNTRHPFSAVFRFFEWKLIRLLKFTNYKKSLWGDKKIYLNYDSFQSMWIMYNYIVDWEEFNLIEKYVKNGDVVFDIGSNMGFYTIWFSKFIGNNGSVFSFEPDSKNFSRLKKNIELNNLDNQISANQLAVSDHDGVVKFTTGFDGENHISNSGETNISEVNSIRLDSFYQLKSITKVSYLKIDVEGFEYAVLKGGEELFNKKIVDIIQLEINSAIENSATSIEMILQLLKEYNYTLCKYDIVTNKLVSIDYHSERENYFAVADIYRINKKLNGGGE